MSIHVTPGQDWKVMDMVFRKQDGRAGRMKRATGGNEPSIVERKKGGSCHLIPHINTEEKHRPP